MNGPLVSVIITAYNREKYIAEAIESVLASTYDNFELIIVDDCSTDGTVEIAKKYVDRDERVKLFINNKNLGDYQNRNKAAGYAKGKYIKYCDSDDKLFDWTLDYCVEMMEKYPDAGMGILNLNKEVKQEYLKPSDAIHMNFFQQEILAIGPSGTIISRDKFEELGRFSAAYGPASDMYSNLKMAAAFPIVLLDKVFFFYRVHEGQQIQNKYGYLCHNYRYLKDSLNKPEFPLDKQQKSYLLKKAKKSFVNAFFGYLKQTGKVGKAMRALQISGVGVKGFLGGVAMKFFSKRNQ